MEQNRTVIQNEIATLVFYMQGGLDYNDAFLLSSDQRRVMSKVVEKHYSAMSGKDNNRLI